MSRLSLLALLTAIGACNARPGGENSCIAAVDGRQFMHELSECGGCECAAVELCDWVADFDGTRLTWYYPDYSAWIDVTCTDGELRDTTTGQLRGTYDTAGDQLTLDGASYAPCNGECQPYHFECDCCAGLAGTTFVSDSPGECGLCPSGDTAACDWTVSFDGSTYEWSYSDVVQSDAYTCDNGDLTMNGVTDASYDALTQTLSLAGRTYHACGEPCMPDPGTCP